MGRKVHLWCFGHYGRPIIVFPSAAGFAHEWQAQGMLETLAPLIQQGKIKLYCPESNVAEAWTRQENTLEWRMARHRAYESFVLNTLIPFVREDCHQPKARMVATGCSLGAMYACNFTLKYPQYFYKAICMSGRYNARVFTEGQSSMDVYFNNPISFVSNLHGKALEQVKNNVHVTLICGTGAYEDGCIEETIQLGRILKLKNIPNHIDIWGKESKHDWNWWKKQAKMYFNHYFIN